MFRHVVLFRWVDGVTDEQVAAISDELLRLPSIIPELRAYWVGPDAGASEGNFDYAVVADFDDVDSWRVYRDNPEHQRIATEMIRPLVTERAAVQSSGHG